MPSWFSIKLNGISNKKSLYRIMKSCFLLMCVPHFLTYTFYRLWNTLRDKSITDDKIIEFISPTELYMKQNYSRLKTIFINIRKEQRWVVYCHLSSRINSWVNSKWKWRKICNIILGHGLGTWMTFLTRISQLSQTSCYW